MICATRKLLKTIFANANFHQNCVCSFWPSSNSSALGNFNLGPNFKDLRRKELHICGELYTGGLNTYFGGVCNLPLKTGVFKIKT